MGKDELRHYGILERSGRYPWGSGEDPYQRLDRFYSDYKGMRKEGISDNDIAKKYGMSIIEFRAARSEAKEREQNMQRIRCRQLAEHGYSNVEIAKRLGVTEGTVRNLRNELTEEKVSKNRATADILKKNADQYGYVDISVGTELQFSGVSKDRLKTATQMLINEGYVVENIYVPQATMPGQYTTVKVLAKPGTTKQDIYKNMDKIHIVNETTKDNGLTWDKIKEPESFSSKRLGIVYGDQGGTAKDGVIELRRGVKDISLGGSNYAQVRIKVDDNLYLKGMAMYADDLPDGIDIRFNTNKPSGTPLNKVLKKMKTIPGTDEIDKENPFGALIKAGGQVYYPDPNGKYINPETGEKSSITVINKLKEEGDWDAYSKTLSSQFLSKQPKEMVKRQLDISLQDKLQEYKEIEAIKNPIIRRHFLEQFANDCDASSVELKAAALPRQSSKVILPMECLKDTEVYAPSYKDGEQLALIRYPHEGIFQIPILTVNNHNPKARKILPASSIDAIGINSAVAQIMSGADFDGDTVMVIPTNNGYTKVKNMKPLEGLKNFDPSAAFPGYPGMHVMDNGNTSGPEKAVEMGMISNLITDMTLKGAPPEELTRAVRHSMVVIDAPKHELDYKSSEIANGIPALKKKWQGASNAGASTLVSKSSGPLDIPERKEGQWYNKKTGKYIEGNDISSYNRSDLIIRYIDPDTGKKLYRNTGGTHNKPLKETKYETDPKTGKTVKVQYYIRDENGRKVYDTKDIPNKQQTTKMAAVDDAFKLSSGHIIETLYANYANNLKGLANKSRKEMVSISGYSVDPKAKAKYASEVASLKSKLDNALRNAPRERKAQLVAAKTMMDIRKKYNELNNVYDKDAQDKLKKYSQRALSEARDIYGAHKKDVNVIITDKEWEAINANAISSSTLISIINNTDTDKLRKLATPNNNRAINQTRVSRAKALSANGYTLQEIADKLGISPSTVAAYIKM